MPVKEQQTIKSLGHTVVVGGCGFLGHHIVNLILQRHPETRISVLDLRTERNRNSSKQVSYHDCDITDLEAIAALMKELSPDVVMHTASPVFNAPQKLHYSVNVDGTKNLLAASQDAGVKAFVYTSSASVIQGETPIVNADETWPTVSGKEAPEYYTSTKTWAEFAVLSENRKPRDNFLTCAIRPAGIFGEGDVQALPNMVKAYHKGQTKFQLGTNENLFDFTYVLNIAHAHLLATVALLHTNRVAPTVPLDNERVDGEAFFCTNDSPVYFWDFVRSVWKNCGDTTTPDQCWKLGVGTGMFIGGVLEWLFWFAGKKPNLDRQKVRWSSIPRYYSIDKAKKRLGYRPIVDLETGIKKAVAYIIEQEKAEAEKKSQ